MKKSIKITLSVLLFLLATGWAVWFFTTHGVAVLDPKGLIAEKQRSLLFTATWLMLIVVVPVFIMTVFFAWKYRAGNRKATYSPNWAHSYLAECIWWGVPCVIILILAIITWTSSHTLSPFKPIESDRKTMTIQVVALQWKWLFIYPEQRIATVNFIQFPEKTPVRFEITADAPMNSFWIPELGGQIYAMPAMRTAIHLIANERGVFRGSSAHLSGEGFAGMTFTAEATSQEEFNKWVKCMRTSCPSLDLAKYDQLVVPSSYVPPTCYAKVDPDLFDKIILKYMTPPVTKE